MLKLLENHVKTLSLGTEFFFFKFLIYAIFLKILIKNCQFFFQKITFFDFAGQNFQ